MKSFKLSAALLLGSVVAISTASASVSYDCNSSHMMIAYSVPTFYGNGTGATCEAAQTNCYNSLIDQSRNYYLTFFDCALCANTQTNCNKTAGFYMHDMHNMQPCQKHVTPTGTYYTTTCYSFQISESTFEAVCQPCTSELCTNE